MCSRGDPFGLYFSRIIYLVARTLHSGFRGDRPDWGVFSQGAFTNQMPGGAKSFLAGAMSPSQIDAVNGQLRCHLEAAVVPEFLEFPEEIPEPDSQFIDEYLISLERFSDFVDEMEEPLSDVDRKFLKESSIMLFVLVNKIDQLIESVRSLPESVLWKQKIYDKLVDLANEIEDVAEVWELAVDEEFNKMIKTLINHYITQ